MKRIFLYCIALITLLLSMLPARAQYLAPAQTKFTRQDTLRGSITPERAWWDLTFLWNNCVQGFNMPLRIYVSGVRKDIVPTSRFSTIDLETDNAVISADPNYYVGTLNMTGK